MPEYCKGCLGRDANNNTCLGSSYGNANHTCNGANGGGNGSGGGGPNGTGSSSTMSSSSCGGGARHIQVTAKVMFGSVQAISHMKMAEKAARENKRT